MAGGDAVLLNRQGELFDAGIFRNFASLDFVQITQHFTAVQLGDIQRAGGKTGAVEGIDAIRVIAGKAVVERISKLAAQGVGGGKHALTGGIRRGRLIVGGAIDACCKLALQVKHPRRQVGICPRRCGGQVKGKDH